MHRNVWIALLALAVFAIVVAALTANTTVDPGALPQRLPQTSP